MNDKAANKKSHKAKHDKPQPAEVASELPVVAPPTLPDGQDRDARIAAGKARRQQVSRGVHAEWMPPSDRRDPVEILIESSAGRLPELLPIRYGRMLQSPFTFFRGAAAVMAADLARTPASGIQVQACGDCHLLNFGAFATPERKLLFDLNDFDETLPGPWEWDLKRLAASFVIAGRNNGFPDAAAQDTARAVARSYREHMDELSGMRALDVWYAHIEMDALLERFEDADTVRRARKRIAKAAARDVLEEDYPALVSEEGGKPRIRDNPPLIYHPEASGTAAFEETLRTAFAGYRESLPDDRRLLLDRYRIEDLAIKVVGVGSVGTACGILLMLAEVDDPLFLQVKEARTSVLEPYLGRSPYACRGQRVVVGQRLMQSASDIFLGWTVSPSGRHFYVRQLRDMKIKPMVELFDVDVMTAYAEACGWALARAHARSGDAARISGYLGKSARFDDALTAFAAAYAYQNERDHAALMQAVRAGRIEAYLER
ncbi:uncharacterized protein (DUF2252 family) [Plasticicumulans lactativorans]|uniref:Uncharacterized protein (DUF2252 family) n=1 Tax=Plasticicumulans lactativorans TaxID=1133106 RepID=A0A4R2L5I3_9GAMM|nr:DUF2252 domain-containing protein [Plasticicumulans lactativorans]TCO82644.1 uncharacterized protein (DUF2252 family) [Plasticicumulans lactativorans]